MDNLEIRKTVDRGRGVFALKNYEIGEIIEICPVVILTEDEIPHIEKTILDYYIFPWTSLKDGAVVLGYGMLHNHSNTPNADYFKDFENKTMLFKAIKPINSGDEITINYGTNPEDPEFPEWVNHMPQR